MGRKNLEGWDFPQEPRRHDPKHEDSEGWDFPQKPKRFDPEHMRNLLGGRYRAVLDETEEKEREVQRFYFRRQARAWVKRHLNNSGEFVQYERWQKGYRGWEPRGWIGQTL